MEKSRLLTALSLLLALLVLSSCQVFRYNEHYDIAPSSNVFDPPSIEPTATPDAEDSPTPTPIPTPTPTPTPLPEGMNISATGIHLLSADTIYNADFDGDESKDYMIIQSVDGSSEYEIIMNDAVLAGFSGELVQAHYLVRAAGNSALIVLASTGTNKYVTTIYEINTLDAAILVQNTFKYYNIAYSEAADVFTVKLEEFGVNFIGVHNISGSATIDETFQYVIDDNKWLTIDTNTTNIVTKKDISVYRYEVGGYKIDTIPAGTTIQLTYMSPDHTAVLFQTNTPGVAYIYVREDAGEGQAAIERSLFSGI